MTRHLTGVGAVPGRVSGPAHVVDLEAAALTARPGTILVVRVFHPFFAPVLPRITGLIVQEGGLLQHAVVLAREFGVPTVVGVGDAVTAISSGDLVTLDGSSGGITVARRSSGDEPPGGGAPQR